MARFAASDPCGGDITWSIEGDDADAFTIVGGELKFVNTPDYENPVDDDVGNDYEITVIASDGELTDDIDVTIDVTNVNEAPDIDGDLSPNYTENGTGTVATYTADDPEDDEITWTLDGDDADAFTIDDDGDLEFVKDPRLREPARFRHAPRQRI